MILKEYGWDEHFEKEWKHFRGTCHSNIFPARIIADYGQMLRVISDSGELLVSRPLNKNSAAKQIRRETEALGEFINQLAVGDWIVLEHSPDTDTNLVRALLTRKTKFSRTAAGIQLKEQIVAANMDIVFIIQSLNRDFNMKRLERYLISTWESGATPVIILSKSDCCDDSAEKISIVYDTAPSVDVHAISSVTGEGLDRVRKYIKPGKTVALLGSSGVGKSTLVNTLAGNEILRTGEIREDDCRGRHITTRRELILLPEGGLILDTPGMRSLSLWEADAGMELMFGEVEELINQCRFHDCKHQNEPGCAVREALQNGKLEMRKWESWIKLQKELDHLEAKKEGKLRQQEKQWGKQIAKIKKEIYNGRKQQTR